MNRRMIGWLGTHFSWRFEVLLVALVLFLGGTPFIDNHIVTGLVASVVLISSVAAVHEGRALTNVAWILAILSMVTLWAADLAGRVDLVVLSGFSEIAFTSL